MELITIKRTSISPKKQLLTLLLNSNDHFILMMSDEWFREFEKCTGVEEYEFHNSSSYEYQLFDLYENNRWNSKSKKTIKVINVEGTWVLITHGYKDATIIYYLE